MSVVGPRLDSSVGKVGKLDLADLCSCLGIAARTCLAAYCCGTLSPVESQYRRYQSEWQRSLDSAVFVMRLGC